MNSNFFKGQLKFFILKVLNKQPVHGYLLMQKISEDCMNLWKPTAGALYPALEELLQEKMIEVKTEAKTGRKKKVYAITKAGKKKFRELSEHIEGMKESFEKFAKDPELSKYNQEDAMFLFTLIHNSLKGKLEKHKSTLFEFSMLARNGRLSKSQVQKAQNAFGEFLDRMRKINSETKN